MGFMEIVRQYGTNPVIAFTVGTALIYGILAFLDLVQRKRAKPEPENPFDRITRLAGQQARLTAINVPEHTGTAEDEIEHLQNLLADTRQIFEDLMARQLKEKADLNSRVTVLDAEKNNLSDTLAAARTDEAALEQQVAGLTKDLEKAGNELKQAGEESAAQIRRLEEEHTAVKTEMESRLTALTADKEGLTADLAAGRDQNASLEEKVKELDAGIETARKDHEKAVEELNRQIRKIEQERDEVKADLEGRLTALTEETDKKINSLTRENNSLNANLADVRSEKALLEKTAADQATQLETIPAEYEQARQKLHEKIGSLEQEKDKHSSTAGELAGELAQVKTTLAETMKAAEADKTAYEERIAGLEQEITTLKSAPADSASSVEALAFEEEKKQLTTQLNQYRVLLMQLQGKLGSYRMDETVDDPAAMIARDPVSRALYEENKKSIQKLEEQQATIEKLMNELEALETLYDENRDLKQVIEQYRSGAAAAPEAPADPVIEAAEDPAEPKSTARGRKPAKGKEAKKKRRSKVIKGIDQEPEAEEQAPPARPARKATEFEETVLSDDDLMAEMQDTILPAPQAASGPQAAAEEADDRLYNIFLPRLTSKDKKDLAAPLLAEVTGITAEEAAKLVEKLIIPIAKGVDRAQADVIKDRFKAIGIMPRVRRQI